MKSLSRLALIGMLALQGTAAYGAGEPSVLVRTAAMKRQPLAQVLIGYGTVVPDAGSTINLNLPRPGRIARLLVIPGETVKRGAPLLDFDTGAAAALGYQQAAAAVAFARSELGRVQQLLAQQLATQSQLAAARRAVEDAQATWHAQRELGTGTNTERMAAPFDALVVSVAVAQGDRIAAGATVLQLARPSGLRVDLGIELADSDRVKAGMRVRLSSVLDASRNVRASISEVHGMVNPQTELVDAVVRLGGRTFMPGMHVRGEITAAIIDAWTVPRSAVLRDSRGAYIFQVKKDRAVRVGVRVLGEQGELTGIRGAFDSALPVVVLGAYELKDAMAVREAAR